jgi:dTDP-4-amino-4,6-dideoxygalactose transaminase
MNNSVFITRSVIPELSEYSKYLDHIFTSRYLTNNGAYTLQLEKKLTAYLGVPYLALCANGTLALQIALRVAGLAGKEVITTPFSYVATVSALLWEGCKVVFADIDEESLCLDLKTVSEKITSQTAGFLPVHVYGNICDVDALDALAQTAHLTILYDAAQCFGSVFEGRSVLDYGDYTACSFHATKVFHTVEGGCVVTRTADDYEACKLIRACGHRGDAHIRLGLNAKLSELHAAMGLSLLDKVNNNIAGRKKVSQMYDALLPAHNMRRPAPRSGLSCNYAYYPVIFDDEKTALQVFERLSSDNIFPRRYFYPALNTLPYLPNYQPCPVAESIASRVLCLPLYAELGEDVVDIIVRTIRECV